MSFDQYRTKGNVRFSENSGFTGLRRMDEELQHIFASLSPSLEALAKLAPIDQVGKIKSLISILQSKAVILAEENSKIKELVDKFEGKMSPEDAIESNYINNLYKNKIMSKQYQKTKDPNCNKQTQVRICHYINL